MTVQTNRGIALAAIKILSMLLVGSIAVRAAPRAGFATISSRYTVRPFLARADAVDGDDLEKLAGALSASFTVPQLKEKLRARSLPVGGKKAALIARLLAVVPDGATADGAAPPPPDVAPGGSAPSSTPFPSVPLLPTDAIVIEACKS